MGKLEICSNPECQQLLQLGGDDAWVERGGSVFCCGKLPEPIEELFGDILHVNDYMFCLYSPAKGMMDYKINANDAFIMETQMGIILKDYRTELEEMSPI